MRFQLIAVSLLTFFLPLGIYVVYRAYLIEEAPHEFVMLIFSGTLMILLGLTGFVGLFHGAIKSPGPLEDGEAKADQDDQTGPDQTGSNHDCRDQGNLGSGHQERAKADDWSKPDLEIDDYDGDYDLDHEKESDDSGEIKADCLNNVNKEN
ncbi:MAG: hypothetical protein LBE80_07850 [Deltaproteobacteria bacterium]|jgi:hypothetical protein|nr:hypothetical protein [Deltaproteobacteria bacterium]